MLPWQLEGITSSTCPSSILRSPLDPVCQYTCKAVTQGLLHQLPRAFLSVWQWHNSKFPKFVELLALLRPATTWKKTYFQPLVSMISFFHLLLRACCHKGGCSKDKRQSCALWVSSLFTIRSGTMATLMYVHARLTWALLTQRRKLGS